MLPPLTATRLFSTWRFDGWATAAILLLAVGYLAGVRSARRRGHHWPAWRVSAYLVLGLGSIAVATMSGLTVYGRVLLWPAAVQVTVLVTVVPLCLGLGDPLGLLGAALPPGAARRWQALLRSTPVRVLTFPVVGAVLATVTQLVVFFTGYLAAAERSATVMHLLELQVVVTGCLFALPLLGVELLPRWVNQPLRMAFAGLDGLLDAIPGVAVIGAASPIGTYYAAVHPSWAGGVVHDQSIAGGLMITIAEVIALPFVAVLFRAWIREDAANASRYDAEADLAAAVSAAVADSPAARELGLGQQPGNAASTRPWWETDPGPLADRARRFGWTHDET